MTTALARKTPDAVALYAGVAREPIHQVRAIVPKDLMQAGVDLFDRDIAKGFRIFESTMVGRTLVGHEVWSAFTVRVEPHPEDLVSRLSVRLSDRAGDAAYRYRLIDEPIKLLMAGPTTWLGKAILIGPNVPMTLELDDPFCEHEWTAIHVDIHGWEITEAMAEHFNPLRQPWVFIERPE